MSNDPIPWQVWVARDRDEEPDSAEAGEAGDRYRGSWWRKVVKPGLKALPDVEAPARGASDWSEVQL